VSATIDATARTSAPAAAVWALLADASKWSHWGAWSKVDVEGGGEQEPGAVRLLVRWPYRLRERITTWVPEERMGYELLEGMPVRGYRSDVTLERTDEGGTVVRWHSTYDRADPITAIILRFAVRDACNRVAKAAAARHG
jgi:Polyketide cyclase / dehydrase and lipid transport